MFLFFYLFCLLIYMKYICPLCSIDPLSHSLSELFEKNNVLYYYTCPSKAKMYFDVVGILNHYDGVFSEIPENKKWISSKFSQKLQKVIIINPNFYTKSVYNIIYPFLNQKIKSIVELNYELTSQNDIFYKIQ